MISLCLTVDMYIQAHPCLFTDCLEPNITNAIIEAPRGTTYGEVVLVYCDEGYSLNGPSLITCRDGPQWSDLPTCVIKSNAFKYVYAHNGCHRRLYY